MQRVIFENLCLRCASRESEIENLRSAVSRDSRLKKACQIFFLELIKRMSEAYTMIIGERLGE